MSIVDDAALFPSLVSVSVENVVVDDTTVRIQAAAETTKASCPGCGGVSRRVHSHYRRAVRDPAVGGRSTMIELRVRRFFCDVAACVKKTFVEQVAGLTTRHARHSVAARHVLLPAALVVGGRAGQRLTGWLSLPTGRMSLLRLLRAVPDRVVVTPKMLAVDLSRPWDYPEA
jgi:hypothetical protein